MDLTKYGFREGFDENNRVVKQETIEFEGNIYWVSTVDLGLNHRYGEGEPLWYETMIFPKDELSDMYCNRYTTREEALQAHEDLIDDIKNGKYVLNGSRFQQMEEKENENIHI